jgi:acetoin utilization deacetylase AcuC-like enzyme
MKIVFTRKCLEYSQAGHPESAARVKSSADLLRGRYEFVEPTVASEETIGLVHPTEHLIRVKSRSFVDWDTPAYEGIYDYARLSVGAAVQAAELALGGDPAFSLMRPPGHHAGRDSVSGFCYFNNIAIAVRKVLQDIERIAIIDFDCHHGNGTQSIFLGDSRVLYVSLHQSPLYPGTGLTRKENCLNYPIPAGTGENEYMKVFRSALTELIQFNPSMIAVSAGFDAFKDDPITDMGLDIGTFERIGEEIHKLNEPTFSILEGGYADRLGDCIAAYLKGLES